jgi:heptosyltransferase-2
MKILVIALSGIGDALMFTPALNLLRKQLPEADIDALVMFNAVKEMYERNENISNVLHFDFLNRGAAASLKFVLRLRRKYDVSINVYPSNRKEYNIIQFLIGAKKRVAVKYLRRNLHEWGFLNNLSITEDDRLHNVQTNIKLIEKLLNTKFEEQPELYFPLLSTDENYARHFLIDKKIKNEDFVIGFHPGSATLKNHVNRRWEPEKFAALAKMIIAKYNVKILLFGGDEELNLKKKILNEINSDKAIIVSTENLPQSAALVKRCNLFVTNDSSMLHIASAMKRKVIAIIGPTNINYIHPWKTDYEIISLNLDCSPCFFYSPRPLICNRKDIKFKCIKELDVKKVYDAVEHFISQFFPLDNL